MAATWLGRMLTATAAAGLIAATVITPGPADVPQLPRTTLASATVPAGPTTPRPPRLPANFRGKGRYIVRDLGVDVPFTWHGSRGNSQMIAGGPQYRIWFTNLIYRNTLYTVTYKWPGIPLNPNRRCDKAGAFSRQDLNNGLRKSRFVGPEILQGSRNRHVDHWRLGVVVGSRRPGKHLRFPFALGDIYVDQKDPSQWWQVLQFGLQNLYDPQLDEWFTMRTSAICQGRSRFPGRVRLQHREYRQSHGRRTRPRGSRWLWPGRSGRAVWRGQCAPVIMTAS
jgi:hypothetical protein